MWEKQISDKIIDGIKVSKSRVQLEPQIYPNTNIIKSIADTDTKIYVKNIYPTFTTYDSITGTLNNIRIVSQDVTKPATATATVSENGTISNISVEDGGFGYTSTPQVSIQPPEKVYAGAGITATATATLSADGDVASVAVDNVGAGYNSATPPAVLIEPEGNDVEKIVSATYSGDYGKITGISTTKTGSQHQLIFDITPDPLIVSALNDNRPNIVADDYFVIENTGIGSVGLMPDGGVKSIGSDESTVVGIGSTWIDGVYQVKSVTTTGVGDTSLRVTTNVSSLTGIDTTGIPEPGEGLEARIAGTYSWGYINVTRNATTAKSFTFYNENGIAGIETSAYISRTLQLKTEAST